MPNSEDEHDSDDTLTGSDNGEDNDDFFDASNKMFPSGDGCRLYLQKDGHCFNPSLGYVYAMRGWDRGGSGTPPDISGTVSGVNLILVPVIHLHNRS